MASITPATRESACKSARRYIDAPILRFHLDATHRMYGDPSTANTFIPPGRASIITSRKFRITETDQSPFWFMYCHVYMTTKRN